MKRKKLLSVLLSLAMVFSLSAPALAAESPLLISPAPAASEDIVILYTNDIHTYIDNDGLRYSDVAGLKAHYESMGANVILVDAGDHIQGTAYGSMDKGKTIIDLMNAADYDVATLGNHEFDYDMDGAINAIEWAQFEYTSCNFYHEQNGVIGDRVLPPYVVVNAGDVNVAFIGITTPETFTSTTPAYFQDDDGEFIYGIAGGEDGSALYEAVQTAIDDASAEADIVIALGHLGDYPTFGPWTSEQVIANTTGLDAFIDGHSHSTVEGKSVSDKNGNAVLLTQTGEYLNAIGKMSISSNGSIHTELLTAETLPEIIPDAEVNALEDAWISEIDCALGEVIGYSQITLDNYDADGTRLVRSRSTNSGEFAADALYYLFRNMGLDVDAAVMNGGGIRNKAITGELTYKTCKEIHTFGNVACLISVTGQQLLDGLEWGARQVGAAEEGGLLHPSGLRYTVDASIPCTVQTDEKGMWIGGPTGEYRVKDVTLYDWDTGSYVPLDVNATYHLAGYNYTLRNLGDGCNMYTGAPNVLDYVMEDYMVLANYIQSFPVDDATGLPTIGLSTQEPSPVYSNYASVYGTGRITIIDGAVEQPEAPSAAEPAASTYVVMPGDCLWSIAAETLGSGAKWTAIFEANKDLIKDPGLIYAGQILTLPKN